MYSSQTISQIRELRKNGYTLTEIVRKTGLSKSRTFDYIRDIPQSEYLVEKIKRNRLYPLKAIADKRRGKSLKKYTFLKPKKWNPDLVNMISHLLFDGRVTRVSCTYFNRSESLIISMERKMRKLLGVSDYKRYITKEGVKRLSYFNVEIATFIRKKADELFTYIISAPIENKISFLQAFFDDEGSIKFRNKTRVVRGYQHSLNILEIVHNLLKDIGIESKVDANFFEVVISKKENLLKFQKLINFNPGLKVNGKRSNSIWKKDLEKREILQMAIDSYLK